MKSSRCTTISKSRDECPNAHGQLLELSRPFSGPTLRTRCCHPAAARSVPYKHFSTTSIVLCGANVGVSQWSLSVRLRSEMLVWHRVPWVVVVYPSLTVLQICLSHNARVLIVVYKQSNCQYLSVWSCLQPIDFAPPRVHHHHYCANFLLRCDTIDERGGSTQRHDVVDKCAQWFETLRWHLSQCESSVQQHIVNTLQSVDAIYTPTSICTQSACLASSCLMPHAWSILISSQ